MADIVDFSKRKQTTQEDKELNEYYENHDFVLDAAEQVFPHGAVIVAFAEDGSVQVSATIDDHKDIVEGLISAALYINRQENKDA